MPKIILNKFDLKPTEGATIIAYGQEAIIVEVITVNGKHIIYLDHSIVVPTTDYTRDYINIDEIQKYVTVK